MIGVRDQNGHVRAIPVEKATGPVLREFIGSNVPGGATIITYYHKGYDLLKTMGFAHKRVNHSVGEYVKDMAHTRLWTH
jgi:ISXO2-like transposase domain